MHIKLILQCNLFTNLSTFCKRQCEQILNQQVQFILSENYKDLFQICFKIINQGQNWVCSPERTLGKSWSRWRQSVRFHPHQGWRRTACMWCPAAAEEPAWPLLLSCENQRRTDDNRTNSQIQEIRNIFSKLWMKQDYSSFLQENNIS